MLPKVSVLGFVGPAMVSLSANFLLVVRIKVRNPFKANAGQLCGYWGEGWTVTTEVNSVRAQSRIPTAQCEKRRGTIFWVHTKAWLFFSSLVKPSARCLESGLLPLLYGLLIV